MHAEFVYTGLFICFSALRISFYSPGSLEVWIIEVICILLKAVKEGPGGMVEIENTHGLKFISIRFSKHRFLLFKYVLWVFNMVGKQRGE